MKKHKLSNDPTQKYRNILEPLALLSAIGYIISVNDNLAVYIQNKIVNHPDVYEIIFPLLVIAYFGIKKRNVSVVGIIIITILVTASLIWFFGFYINYNGTTGY